MLLLEGHFLDGEVLRSRLCASLERVCLAALGSQVEWDRAILSAEQAVKKGVHGLDGPITHQTTRDSLRLGTTPAGKGQLARLMKRGASAYPDPQLLSGCAIGRLGARVPDSSVPRRLPRKAVPELRVVV